MSVSVACPCPRACARRVSRTPDGHIPPRGRGPSVSLCLHGCGDTRVRALPVVLPSSPPPPPSRRFAPRQRPVPASRTPGGARGGVCVCLVGGAWVHAPVPFCRVPGAWGGVGRGCPWPPSGQCRGRTVPVYFPSLPPPVGPTGRGQPVGSKLPVTLKRPSLPVPGPGGILGGGTTHRPLYRATAQGDKRPRKSGRGGGVRGSRAAGPVPGPGQRAPLGGTGRPRRLRRRRCYGRLRCPGRGVGEGLGGVRGFVSAPAAGNRRCYHPVY